MDPDLANVLAPVFGVGVMSMSVAWVINTWLRVKHGYPLENSWGKAIYPQKNDEAVERVRLLTQENAQLRAEVGSMKDRLANVERIVTDGGYRIGQEIEALRERALESRKDEGSA